MPDILIRDVPDRIIAAIDAEAQRLRISRTEFLRRELTIAYGRPPGKVTVEDLERFARVTADLNDPEIMARAWDCGSGDGNDELAS